MATFFAPDRISPLQWNLRIAITAQVVDGGAFDGQASLEGVAARSRDCGRDLVRFSGHSAISRRLECGCGFEEWLLGGMQKLSRLRNMQFW